MRTAVISRNILLLYRNYNTGQYLRTAVISINRLLLCRTHNKGQYLRTVFTAWGPYINCQGRILCFAWILSSCMAHIPYAGQAGHSSNQGLSMFESHAGGCAGLKRPCSCDRGLTIQTSPYPSGVGGGGWRSRFIWWFIMGYNKNMFPGWTITSSQGMISQVFSSLWYYMRIYVTFIFPRLCVRPYHCSKTSKHTVRSATATSSQKTTTTWIAATNHTTATT